MPLLSEAELLSSRINAGKDMRKRNLYTLLVGIHISDAIMEIGRAFSNNKGLVHDPAIFLFYIQKEISQHRIDTLQYRSPQQVTESASVPCDEWIMK